MGYESVDRLQKFMAKEIFSHAKDSKKASGRALGTLVEIISYYLLKAWKFENFTAIERPLAEYANESITHNVEFTLHGSKFICRGEFDENSLPMSAKKIQKCNENLIPSDVKNVNIVDKSKIIRNACTIHNGEKNFINVYANSRNSTFDVFELVKFPFAMLECKRVGVEEGNRKGPQTIEKAKQGSYVARSVSALQRIRKSDGSLFGFVEKSNGDFVSGDYYRLLGEIIKSDSDDRLRNFVLTVGIVSNHGNWFTSENQNKELKVLSQSYDWLIFLSDRGLSEFVSNFLLSSSEKYAPVRNAFLASYVAEKKSNIFTKVKMEFEADKILTEFFFDNLVNIEAWFNVISPQNRSLTVLKKEIITLSKKRWQEIYA